MLNKVLLYLYRTKCKLCDGQFYEYRYSSLTNCPHCNQKMNASTSEILERPVGTATLNVITGELTVGEVR